MGRVEDVCPPAIHHRAPTGRGRLNAKAEKAQRCLVHDGARHSKGGLNDNRRQRRRNDVAAQNSRGAGAKRTSGLYVVEFSRPQHLPANEPRVADPSDGGQSQQDVRKARPEHCHNRDSQQQARECEQRVDDATNDLVYRSAVITGDRSDQDSDKRRDTDYRYPHEQ
jgi:hypothetical protein